MTDTTTTATAVPATAHDDIKALAKTVLSKIDGHQATRGEVSTWLSNAKSSLQSAIQYIERDWESLVAKLGGEAQAAAASPAPQPMAPAAAPAPATAPAAADPAPAAATASTDAPTADTAPAAAPSTASV